MNTITQLKIRNFVGTHRAALIATASVITTIATVKYYNIKLDALSNAPMLNLDPFIAKAIAAGTTIYVETEFGDVMLQKAADIASV